jgi:hypothetical protein
MKQKKISKKNLFPAKICLKFLKTNETHKYSKNLLFFKENKMFGGKKSNNV